jgi:hypothetical protein
MGNKGPVPMMQRDGSTTKLGGIMKMAMLGYDLAWVLYSINVVLVLDNLVLF